MATRTFYSDIVREIGTSFGKPFPEDISRHVRKDSTYKLVVNIEENHESKNVNYVIQTVQMLFVEELKDEIEKMNELEGKYYINLWKFSINCGDIYLSIGNLLKKEIQEDSDAYVYVEYSESCGEFYFEGEVYTIPMGDIKNHPSSFDGVYYSKEQYIIGDFVNTYDLCPEVFHLAKYAFTIKKKDSKLIVNSIRRLNDEEFEEKIRKNQEIVPFSQLEYVNKYITSPISIYTNADLSSFTNFKKIGDDNNCDDCILYGKFLSFLFLEESKISFSWNEGMQYRVRMENTGVIDSDDGYRKSRFQFIFSNIREVNESDKTKKIYMNKKLINMQHKLNECFIICANKDINITKFIVGTNIDIADLDEEHFFEYHMCHIPCYMFILKKINDIMYRIIQISDC